jgi:predicted ATPase with chaperone activity
MLAAMNPGPFGFYGDPIKPCARDGHQISETNLCPLLDHINIHIEFPASWKSNYPPALYLDEPRLH